MTTITKKLVTRVTTTQLAILAITLLFSAFSLAENTSYWESFNLSLNANFVRSEQQRMGISTKPPTWKMRQQREEFKDWAEDLVFSDIPKSYHIPLKYTLSGVWMVATGDVRIGVISNLRFDIEDAHGKDRRAMLTYEFRF